MRHLIIGFATAVALSTSVSVASAAVYNAQQQLPSSVVDGFKSTPADLLKSYPDGGAQMISRVRDLAASDPATLASLVGLLKGPLSPAQQSAIVSGLAQAARLALTADQPYSTEIQEAMAKSENKAAADQFADLFKNVATGAGGGGGGAAGGGSGGGGPNSTAGFATGGSNSGNAPTFGAQSTTNQGTGLTTGSVSSIGNGASNVVSP
jgi:hypothetical protein